MADVKSVEGIRVSTGAIVAGICGLASVVLLQVVRSFGGAYPVLSWIGMAPLLAVTALVLVMCWQIRRYLLGASVEPPSPQRGRGTLVGAQAAALGGAALFGWYAANGIVHLPNVDVTSERTQLVWGLLHALIALGLSAAGFIGQAWCRIDESDRDHDKTDDRDPRDDGLAYG